MADTVPPVDPPTPPKGTDPTPPDNGEKDKDKFIPKHRFDEVNEENKALKAWRAEQEKKAKEAEAAALAEQGKFKELAEAKEKEAQTLREQLTNTKIETAIQNAAFQQGVRDATDVLKLIDKSAVKVADDGTVTGVEEAVKKLIEAKPYLKGDGKSTPDLGGGGNPAPENNTTVKRFKASQLKDHTFFMANMQDILKAQRLGMIDDDTGGA